MGTISGIKLACPRKCHENLKNPGELTSGKYYVIVHANLGLVRWPLWGAYFSTLQNQFFANICARLLHSTKNSC